MDPAHWPGLRHVHANQSPAERHNHLHCRDHGYCGMCAHRFTPHSDWFGVEDYVGGRTAIHLFQERFRANTCSRKGALGGVDSVCARNLRYVYFHVR